MSKGGIGGICLALVISGVIVHAKEDSPSPTVAPEDVFNVSLRDELLAMRERDQKVRVKSVDQLNEDDRAAMASVDAAHEVRMKAIVAQYGWPTRSMVGDEGADAAWLVVQHCQVDFQERCLPMLERAVQANESSARNYAYLLDRVRMYRGKPQVYGTQFMDGKLVPIEDPAHVDERRSAVGLGPLSEYVATVKRMNGWK